MDKKFDPTKPVRCKDGTPARIICTDRKDPIIPIVACYGKDSEGVAFYKADGTGSFRGGLVNYDPFEITDEEAELIIDILYWRGSIGSRMCQTADKIRKKVDASEIFNGHYIAVRDMVIKHRKTK